MGAIVCGRYARGNCDRRALGFENRQRLRLHSIRALTVVRTPVPQEIKR
jgi:hypothetical protein